MCYFNGAKIKREEVSLFADDYRLIEGFERDLQSGFEYEKYPIAFAKGDKVIGEMAHWEFIPFWIRSIEDLKKVREGIDPKTGGKKINEKTGKVEKPIWLNAQGERMLSSPMYSKAARERRCLVFFPLVFMSGVTGYSGDCLQVIPEQALHLLGGRFGG